VRAEPAADLEPRVRVEGTVVEHDTRTPIVGATVSLGSGPDGTRGRGTRVTDEAGRFGFRDVPAGTYRLSASGQRYRPMSDTLHVSGEDDVELVLPLSTQALHLDPIVVAKERPSIAMRGYEARRRSGRGFVVTREEIRERRPRYLSEMLHRVPGGTVIPASSYGYTLLLRGQCRPGLWIDGVPLGRSTNIDQLVSPNDVEAVEVFHGFELPVEFGVDSCGGVLVWTRMGAPVSGGDGSAREVLGPLLKVVALVVTLLVLTR
jgi:hypothetical protein